MDKRLAVVLILALLAGGIVAAENYICRDCSSLEDYGITGAALSRDPRMIPLGFIPFVPNEQFVNAPNGDKYTIEISQVPSGNTANGNTGPYVGMTFSIPDFTKTKITVWKGKEKPAVFDRPNKQIDQRRLEMDVKKALEEFRDLTAAQKAADHAAALPENPANILNMYMSNPWWTTSEFYRSPAGTSYWYWFEFEEMGNGL